MIVVIIRYIIYLRIFIIIKMLFVINLFINKYNGLFFKSFFYGNFI